MIGLVEQTRQRSSLLIKVTACSDEGIMLKGYLNVLRCAWSVCVWLQWFIISDKLSLFFRRGNPLHLCRERFKKIQKLWQQHSITEEIGHAQEANQTLVGIDWQHL